MAMTPAATLNRMAPPQIASVVPSGMAPSGKPLDRHVATPVHTRGGVDTVTKVSHSTLGDVFGDFFANGMVAVAEGETLTVTYGAASTTGEELGWFLLAGRGTGASATWRRPTREAIITPRQFVLWQNRPNPFSGHTTIRFDLPVTTPVKLEIFDLLGRRIRTLADGRFRPGFHSIQWDQRDNRGRMLRAGVFVYRIKAGAFQAQKKMVLIP